MYWNVARYTELFIENLISQVVRQKYIPAINPVIRGYMRQRRCWRSDFVTSRSRRVFCVGQDPCKYPCRTQPCDNEADQISDGFVHGCREDSGYVTRLIKLSVYRTPKCWPSTHCTDTGSVYIVVTATGGARLFYALPFTTAAYFSHSIVRKDVSSRWKSLSSKPIHWLRIFHLDLSFELTRYCRFAVLRVLPQTAARPRRAKAPFHQSRVAAAALCSPRTRSWVQRLEHDGAFAG